MSMFDLLQDRKEAVAILRRLDEGDDAAKADIHPLLKRIADRERVEEECRSQKLARRDRRTKNGRAKSGAFEVAPRVENGCDHSAKGIVLARKGDLRLIWRYAGKHFANQLVGYISHSADLDILDRSNRMPRSLLNSFNNSRPGGWRLSKKLIMEVAPKIDAVFGDGVAAAVAELKSTVVVDDDSGDRSQQTAGAGA